MRVWQLSEADQSRGLRMILSHPSPRQRLPTSRSKRRLSGRTRHFTDRSLSLACIVLDDRNTTSCVRNCSKQGALIDAAIAAVEVAGLHLVAGREHQIPR